MEVSVLMVTVMRDRSVKPGRLLSDTDKKFYILVGVIVSLCFLCENDGAVSLWSQYLGYNENIVL